MAGYVFAIGNDVDPISAIRECAEKRRVFNIYKDIIIKSI